MKGEYFMMKKHGLRRFFSLLLAVIMVCALLPTAALAEDTTEAGETQSKTVVVDEGGKPQKKEDTPPQNPEQGTPPADDDDSDEGSDSPLLTGSRPVTITVRVFSPSTGVDAVVGSDTAGAGNPGQIQSADYKIPPLTNFVDSSKFGRVTKVAGNWYFPTGDQQPGATVQWSTNSGTGTMTYWVDWYNPDGGGSTTYLWNFTLKYDANGGSGAPADQTWGTNEKYTKSHTFNIPSTVPTRAGYVFKGWSDTKGGSATRQPGGTCLVSQTVDGYNGGSVTKTLYAVWEEDAPAQPDKPSETDVKNLLGNSAVKVHCSTPNSGHTAVTYPLLDGSFTVGDVQGSSGNYSCVVTVTADSYVTAYGGGHRLAAANESPKTITLKYNETTKTWAAYTVTPIVFNVVCDTAPTAPNNDTVKALLGENAVQIICTNTQIGHGSKTFGLIDGTFTVYHSNNRCEVVINDFSSYVSKFNAAVNVPAGTHVTDNSNAGQNRTKINLVWSDGKWTAADAPAKYHVLCSLQPAKPTAPSHDDLSKLIGDITVNCTNNAATHTPKSKGYALVAGSYTTGNVEGSADTGYTFTVTVNAEKYVTQFDTETGAAHTPRDGSKAVTLKYENNAWTVKEGKPVSFDVACVAQPTFDELKELFNQKIFVEYNTKPAHDRTPYDLIAGSYAIEDFSTMTDLPTCTVVLNSKKYVESFNGTTNAVHTPENEVRRIALTFKDGGWGVATDDQLPVVFKVACVPDAPTDDYLKDLLREKVKVTCTATADHATLACDLLNGSYQGSGVQPDGNGGYTYTVTIKAEKYVERYNTKWPKSSHYLVEGEPTEKSVTLVWNADEDKWVFADPKAVPVIFRVECLTVTYEDGVNGSVFKTVSFPNLKKGEATPTIEDPIRVGYKFAGWEPTVAATVTENVTYIAQWEEVDTTFTVKYNDNVKGKAFKEQVYEDLKYNEDTPDFNGKPERSGYTFTGWKPVVADRVTKDVVYYAQWKSNSGKDRVPKTGDGQIVMILGSVLLFSFCGATAVYAFDRKRKQG